MSPRLLRPRASGLFNPASISTLQLWAEPSAARVFSNDAGTTAANSGDGVAVVASRTGTNLVQTTQANRPQLVTNARAGRPCLRFDGLNDSLALSTVLPQANGQHIMAVVDTTNISNAFGQFIFMQRTSATAQNLAFYMRQQDDRPFVYWNGTRATWGAAVRRAAVVRWTFNASATALQVDAGTPATGAAGSILTNWSSVNDSASQTSGFDLYELLIFSSLAAADITTVTNYLMRKYSIT
jgi:hypothetical protein